MPFKEFPSVPVPLAGCSGAEMAGMLSQWARAVKEADWLWAGQLDTVSCRIVF